MIYICVKEFELEKYDYGIWSENEYVYIEKFSTWEVIEKNEWRVLLRSTIDEVQCIDIYNEILYTNFVII